MKKKLMILSVIVAIITILIIGIKIYYTNIEPIDLYLTKENTEEEFIATKGAYNWKENGISVIADSVNPLQMDFSKKIEVKANEKVYFSNDNWTSGGTSLILSKERREIARITIEMNLEDNYIVVPEIEPGEYLIQINLKSEKGEVWYATKINVVK